MDRRRRVRNGKTLVMVLLVTCCSVSYCKVADTIAVAIFNRRSSVRTPTAVRPSLGLFILSNDQSWNSDRSRASELWWEAKGGIHEELSSDGSSRYSRLGMTDGKHARSSYPIGYFSLLSSFCKGGSSFCQVSQSHLYFEPCYRDSFAIVCSQRENATRMFFCSLSNLHSASNSETSYDPRKDRSSKGSIDHLLERGEESVYVYTRQTNRTVLDTRDSSISVFASTVARYLSSVSRIFHSAVRFANEKHFRVGGTEFHFTLDSWSFLTTYVERGNSLARLSRWNWAGSRQLSPREVRSSPGEFQFHASQSPWPVNRACSFFPQFFCLCLFRLCVSRARKEEKRESRSLRLPEPADRLNLSFADLSLVGEWIPRKTKGCTRVRKKKKEKRTEKKEKEERSPVFISIGRTTFYHLIISSPSPFFFYYLETGSLEFFDRPFANGTAGWKESGPFEPEWPIFY